MDSFLSPGGNAQCTMKPGPAVLPYTPCRAPCFLGSTVNCVLETAMAGPSAVALNFQRRACGAIASTPRRSGPAG
eukprot:5618534-Pyramimonas_sp.AAC.1